MKANSLKSRQNEGIRGSTCMCSGLSSRDKLELQKSPGLTNPGGDDISVSRQRRHGKKEKLRKKIWQLGGGRHPKSSLK